VAWLDKHTNVRVHFTLTHCSCRTVALDPH